MKQKYLGDGVYISYDPKAFHPLIITTGNHDPEYAIMTIWFEDFVLEELIKFLEQIK